MQLTRNAKDIIQYVFAGIVMLLLIAIIILLLFYDIPEANKDVLNIGMGVVLGWGSTIVAYFFGSSKGSADKNELINGSKQ